MTNPLASIKPRVRDLRAYSLRPDRAGVKLNQNENPFETPADITKETLKRAADCNWSRYPNFVPQTLHERLAEFSGWKSEGTLAGNGSNELIQALLMVTVGEGKRALISEPTFALYRQIATVLGGEVLSVPLTAELRYDVQSLMARIRTSKPEVTIICSPNNPTGCVLERTDLAALLEATDGLVVVDEAYFEFSGQTTVPLLEKYPNLIVLRTFSKAMALAGLRVGYLLAAPALVREVAKAVLPYNLNLISEIAATVSLEMYEAELKPLIARINAERDRLLAELQRIPGLSPVPSRANFMVVKSSMPPSLVFDELLARGILIRDVSGYPMLRDYFRVSVGTPAENDRLINSLNEIVKVTK